MDMEKDAFDDNNQVLCKLSIVAYKVLEHDGGER